MQSGRGVGDVGFCPKVKVVDFLTIKVLDKGQVGYGKAMLIDADGVEKAKEGQAAENFRRV